MSENIIRFKDWSYDPKEGKIEHSCQKGIRLIFYLENPNHRGYCWGCNTQIPQEIIFLDLIK